MMKLLCKLFFFGCVLCCALATAQNDSINRLEKVSIKVVVNKQQVAGLKTLKVTETQKKRNASGLTEILRYNSPIVFRDYGNGGVSTASFRGTSATNTQVLWNGIPINSVGNGQTDFNALSAFTADHILVQSGGNSVEHGSGAIGGVIRLDNSLEFDKLTKGELFTSLGSYETYSSYFKYALANKKWSLKLAVTHNDSENDFEYIDPRYKDENGKTFKNINGQYNNYGLNLSLGHILSAKSKLFLYSNYYKGTRFFSFGLPNPKAGTEKNADESFRNLLKYEYRNNGYVHTVNTAFLTQEYIYFLNLTDKLSSGLSKTGVVNYSVDKKFSKYLKINVVLGVDHAFSKTDTIRNKNRVNTSQVIHLKSNPLPNLKTSLSLRNETSSFYDLPTVYAVGTEYKILEDFTLKASYSTNFRQPTINELFWPESGNVDLLPETTKQYDIGLEYKIKGLKLSGSYFAIDFKNKINWEPTIVGNNWRPVNIPSVKNKGLEFNVESNFKFKKVFFSLYGNYNYIQAINTETNTRIPFVPKHSYNLNVSVGYSRFILFFQQLYQSKVYIENIELDFYSLTPFYVSNMGLETELINAEKYKVKMGLGVKNMFNELYYFSNLRPMPGRNFNININCKF